MEKTIYEHRTFIVDTLKSYADYLGVADTKINPASDKLVANSAPFINVIVKRISASEMVDSFEAKALVLVIFQTNPKALDLESKDDLFNMYEKLELIINKNRGNIGVVCDMDYQPTFTDTNVYYGVLQFTTDYSPNPPELP